MSFFFNAHSDFFEEIAKYSRRRGAFGREVMRERFGAERRALAEAALSCADSRRVADGAAADEQRHAHRAAGARGSAGRHQLAALPTLSTRRSRCRPRTAATLALRTQQILAHETGSAAASIHSAVRISVERLTDDLEEEAERLFSRHRRHWAGMVAAIERGYPAARDRGEARIASSRTSNGSGR
jgi:methylmalonyl-CoA mutase N-terminal domain/subunit